MEEITPKEKRLIKKENAKNRLLQQLEEGDLRNLTARVAFILNHYPETRDSDLILTLQYWEVFQNALYNNGQISKEAYMKLEQQSDITRARAKVQNDFGTYQASEDTKNRRLDREETYRTSQIELSENATPVTYIFCDESGKTQDTVLMGSFWGHDESLSELRKAINDFKVELGWTAKDEFHFVKVNKMNIEIYKRLVNIVSEYSSTIGFKAICFKKAGSALKIDDIVTRLYTIGICEGMVHEVESGRIALPRSINILKDEESGKDKLIIASQRLEIQTHLKSTFDGRVYLGHFSSTPSGSSHFIQIADLFTSCLGRRLNVKDQQNAKDELARYFFEKFRIDDVTLESSEYDFISIRYLN